MSLFFIYIFEKVFRASLNLFSVQNVQIIATVDIILTNVQPTFYML